MQDARVLHSTLTRTLGTFICCYSYDGLGRQVRKETPITDQPPLELQTKDLYYDGVCRIQEVVTRSVGSESPEDENENNELAEEDPGGPPGTLPPGETWTDREYVYGPDYVDEFVVMIDRDDVPMFFLQDANYNVVALLTGPGDPLGSGAVLAQYTYEPYGELVAVEHLAEHAVNRVGHQGLFFDRFDGTAQDAGAARENRWE